MPTIISRKRIEGSLRSLSDHHDFGPSGNLDGDGIALEVQCQRSHLRVGGFHEFLERLREEAASCSPFAYRPRRNGRKNLGFSTIRLSLQLREVSTPTSRERGSASPWVIEIIRRSRGPRFRPRSFAATRPPWGRAEFLFPCVPGPSPRFSRRECRSGRAPLPSVTRESSGSVCPCRA